MPKAKTPEVRITLRSALTKRFLEDKLSNFHQRLTDELNVTIKTHAQGAKMIVLTADDTNLLEKAELVMQALDQRISVLAEKYSIKGKDDISDRFRGYVGIDVQDLLKKIKTMPTQEFKKIVLEFKPLPTTTIPSAGGKVVVANDVGAAADFSKAATTSSKAAKHEYIHLKDPEFEPRNQTSAIAYTAIKDPNISIVVMGGSAGGGKTYTGMRAAIELLNEGRVNKILVVKPRTTTNKKDIGALKGDLAQKTGPYVDSAISTTMEKLTGAPSSKYKATKYFDAVSPDFERGETYDETLVFIDEAQNLTRQEAKMLITRIGQVSGDKPTKVIVTGDISGNQNDLRGEMPGLSHLIAVLGHAAASNPNGQLAQKMAFVEFSDEDSAARSDLLVDINKAFNNMPDAYKDINTRLDLAGQNPAAAKAIMEGMDFAQAQLTAGADRTRSRYVNKATEIFPQIFGRPDNKVINLKPMEYRHA